MPSYNEIINIEETDSYLEITQKDNSFTTPLPFISVKDIIIHTLSNQCPSDYFFSRRIHLISPSSDGPIFEKDDKFTGMSRSSYKDIVFLYYSIFKKVVKSTKKVAFFLESGVAFHAANWAVNLLGGTSVCFYTLQTEESIINSLLMNEPEVLYLNLNTVDKCLTAIKNSSSNNSNNKDVNKEELFSFVKAVVIDVSNFPLKTIHPDFRDNSPYLNINIKGDKEYKEDKEIEGKGYKYYKNEFGELFKGAPLYFTNPHSALPPSPAAFPASAKDSPPTDNEVVSILHTSATTGNHPKAVPFTNETLLHAINIYYSIFFHKVGKDYSYLSFLPPMHTLEYVVSYVFPALGIKVGFGHPKSLFCRTTRKVSGGSHGDILSFKPDVIVTVPLLLYRIKAILEAEIKKKGVAANFAYNFSLSLKNRFRKIGFVGDYLIFNKIAKAMGDVKLVICGAAMLDDKIKEWAQNVLKVELAEGWGMTETGANGLLDVLFGEKIRNTFCGVPLCDSAVRIYIDKENNEEGGGVNGDLFIKIGSAPEKYLFMEGKQAEIRSEDGWVDTGDYARVSTAGSNYGCVQILGRKKDVVKMDNGEFYNLGMYEGLYGEIEAVDQVMVVLESGMKRPGLLISVGGKEDCDLEEIEKKIREVEANNNVKENICVGKFEVVKDLWNAENGLLTPTMKLRRFKIKKVFEKEIKKIVDGSKE